MSTLCVSCGRAADPDTELLVVVLGVPKCAACANGDDQDAPTNSAPWEVEVEQAVADFDAKGDTTAFASDLRRLGFDDHEITNWIERRA